MKKVVVLFFLLLAPCSLSLMNAQQKRGKFNPEEFKAKLESFITNEAGFTSEEAQAFYPIYHEMKGKQRQLQRSINRLKRDAPGTDASDNEFAITIQKIKDLSLESAQLEVSYYKKLCNVVSPKKVYKAMCAEDIFHRRMLEEFERGKNSPEKGHRPK